MKLIPVTQKQARAFVAEHHRHNKPDPFDYFRVGLEVDGDLVAVAVAGRPKAQALDDGRTVEITRVCTLGHENACSRLYGALCRAAAALGYQRVYTYTLVSETGASPKASGFVLEAEIEERNWGLESGRPRYEENLFGERATPTGRKIRWRRDL